MSISVRIQELREQGNLSQEQLADKLNVSRQAISKWETEQANPDINNIILLSEIFDVSTDYILTGQDKAQVVSKVEKDSSKGNISKAISILLIIFASISAVGLLYYIILFINIKVLG